MQCRGIGSAPRRRRGPTAVVGDRVVKETISLHSSSTCPSARLSAASDTARVPCGGQELDRPVDALNAAGCRRIFAGEKSAKSDVRPTLKACHAFLGAGDTWSARPRLLQPLLAGPITMVLELRKREVGSPRCTSGSTPPHPADGWCSTSSPPFAWTSTATLTVTAPPTRPCRPSASAPEHTAGAGSRERWAVGGGRWAVQAECGGCGWRGDARFREGAVATSDYGCGDDV